MSVTVMLSENVIDDLAVSEPTTPQAQAIVAVADRFNAALVPVHPSTDDSELKRFFTAELADESAEVRFAEALRECGGVDAAYVKPADALP